MFCLASTYFRLYVRVDILLTCGKNLLDRIISPRGDVWANIISLAPPLCFIEFPMPSQENDQSCIYMLGEYILSLSTILIFDFEIVLTVSVLFCLVFLILLLFFFILEGVILLL